MENSKIIIFIALLVFSSCSVQTPVSTDQQAESGNIKNADSALVDSLSAKIVITDTITAGAPIDLKFNVSNNSKTTLQFCKWHTPFEPLMSKYLEIRDENGTEVQYIGAMAKRIMPPPASSFVTLKPNESISSSVDLSRAYDIKKPARYSVIYTGKDISGLAVSDTVSFVYAR